MRRHTRLRLEQSSPQTVARIVGVVWSIWVQRLERRVVERAFSSGNKLGGPLVIAFPELQSGQLDPGDE